MRDVCSALVNGLFELRKITAWVKDIRLQINAQPRLNLVLAG